MFLSEEMLSGNVFLFLCHLALEGLLQLLFNCLSWQEVLVVDVDVDVVVVQPINY